MSNPGKGRPGGVLPINAAATRKTGSSQKQGQRSSAPKLRLIVRRLAPGLTEAEFWESLGDEWRVAAGKVDWAAYKPGKISRDPAKPSRPARAYLKVKDQSLLDELSAKIKQTSFQDAKNTTRDPCLIGPPSLEFAPYNKTPGGRARNDGRQGTIDQDQEFIDFLQSLTEPLTKSAANGTDNDLKQEKVTMTPLVQYIKEKKANKAKEKEAASAKTSKKGQESKDSKSSTKGEPRSTVVVKSTSAANEKARVAKATQDAVKAINRSVASMQTKPTPVKNETKAASKETPATPQPTPKRERTRGDASAAARMVARDLGLAPKEPKPSRGTRVPSSSVESTLLSQADKTPAPLQTKATPTESTNKTATTQPQATANHPPTGPRNARVNNNQTAKTTTPAPAPAPAPPSVPASAQRLSKASPQPSTGAKSAFLKHANPSQGVTEDLLRTTFSVYGTITKCEIDKKKGLGYVDFSEAEGLKKAMAASPVKVGNGSVVVLENRSPYSNKRQQQGNAGASGTTTSTSAAAAKAQSINSATTSAVNSPKPVVASPVPPTANKVTTPVTINASPIATTTGSKDNLVQSPATAASTETPGNDPPTAPKGGRGNNATGRGGRGANSGRGGGGRGPRGRGGQQGRGGRAAGNTAAGNNGAAAVTATTTSAPTAPNSSSAVPAAGSAATTTN